MRYRLAVAALALLLQAGPALARPEKPGDTIEFDPAQAQEDAYLQSYIDAAEICMRGRAETLLYSGERSRSRLADQVGQLCGPALKTALVDHGHFTPDLAASGIQTMAYRAVDDVLAEKGAAVH